MSNKDKTIRARDITNARDGAQEVFVQAVVKGISLLWRHEWIPGWHGKGLILHNLPKGREETIRDGRTSLVD